MEAINVKLPNDSFWRTSIPPHKYNYKHQNELNKKIESLLGKLIQITNRSHNHGSNH